MWLEFAVKLQYLTKEDGRLLYNEYEEVLKMLYSMISNSSQWTIKIRESQEIYYVNLMLCPFDEPEPPLE